MTGKNIALALLALQLASCTMIPPLKSPELPVAPRWEEVPTRLSSEGEKQAAAIGWQEFFISDPLQTVLRETLENNRDLRVAALNVAAARALYRIERADLFPEVLANGRASHQRITEAQSQNTRSDITLSDYTANLASTGFEIDLFGRLRSQNEAALETYFATRAARDAAQISLIAEVANAYLQWLADGDILDLSETTLAAQEKTHELVEKSFQLGFASKLDLVQVTTAVEAAKASRAFYTRRVNQDKNALVLLMGATRDLGESRNLADIRVMENLPVGLPSEVLLLRPDVRLAEHELRAANADIGVARAAFFPRITLTGSFGFASSELGDLFSAAAAGAWSFIPQITMPIFQGGRNKANLEFTQVQKEIALARYEKAIQSAFREVADELAARQTLDSEWQAQSRQVAAIREAYDLSYARYKGGIDSFLSVLDAQRSLFAAQLRLIEIEKQRLANLVNLYKALGGGLMENGAPAAQPENPESERPH